MAEAEAEAEVEAQVLMDVGDEAAPRQSSNSTKVNTAADRAQHSQKPLDLHSHPTISTHITAADRAHHTTARPNKGTARSAQVDKT